MHSPVSSSPSLAAVLLSRFSRGLMVALVSLLAAFLLTNQSAAGAWSPLPPDARAEFAPDGGTRFCFERAPGILYTVERSTDLNTWELVPEASGWSPLRDTAMLTVKLPPPPPGAPPPPPSQPAYSCIVLLRGDPATQLRTAYVFAYARAADGRYRPFRFEIPSFPVPPGMVPGLGLGRLVEPRPGYPAVPGAPYSVSSTIIDHAARFIPSDYPPPTSPLTAEQETVRQRITGGFAWIHHDLIQNPDYDVQAGAVASAPGDRHYYRVRTELVDSDGDGYPDAREMSEDFAGAGFDVLRADGPVNGRSAADDKGVGDASDYDADGIADDQDAAPDDPSIRWQRAPEPGYIWAPATDLLPPGSLAQLGANAATTQFRFLRALSGSAFFLRAEWTPADGGGPRIAIFCRHGQQHGWVTFPAAMQHLTAGSSLVGSADSTRGQCGFIHDVPAVTFPVPEAAPGGQVTLTMLHSLAPSGAAGSSWTATLRARLAPPEAFASERPSGLVSTLEFTDVSGISEWGVLYGNAEYHGGGSAPGAPYTIQKGAGLHWTLPPGWAAGSGGIVRPDPIAGNPAGGTRTAGHIRSTQYGRVGGSATSAEAAEVAAALGDPDLAEERTLDTWAGGVMLDGSDLPVLFQPLPSPGVLSTARAYRADETFRGDGLVSLYFESPVRPYWSHSWTGGALVRQLFYDTPFAAFHGWYWYGASADCISNLPAGVTLQNGISACPDFTAEWSAYVASGPVNERVLLTTEADDANRFRFHRTGWEPSLPLDRSWSSGFPSAVPAFTHLNSSGVAAGTLALPADAGKPARTVPALWRNNAVLSLENAVSTAGYNYIEPTDILDDGTILCHTGSRQSADVPTASAGMLVPVELTWKEIPGYDNLSDNKSEVPFSYDPDDGALAEAARKRLWLPGKGKRVIVDGKTPFDPVPRYCLDLEIRTVSLLSSGSMQVQIMDVDDPTPVAYDKGYVIDPSDDGTDNYGCKAGSPGLPRIVSAPEISGITDIYTSGNWSAARCTVVVPPAGVTTLRFETSRQPGDNFRAVVSYKAAELAKVQTHDHLAAQFLPGEGKWNGTANVAAGSLLTVWRQLTVEVDTMQAPPNTPGTTDNIERLKFRTATQGTMVLGVRSIKLRFYQGTSLSEIEENHYLSGYIAGNGAVHVELKGSKLPGEDPEGIYLEVIPRVELSAAQLADLEAGGTLFDDDGRFMPAGIDLLPNRDLVSSAVISSFSPSYIRVGPLKDEWNSQKTIAFESYSLMQPHSLQSLHDYDAELFWSAGLVNAWQPRSLLSRDLDGDGADTSRTLGVTIGTFGIFVFSEAIRDKVQDGLVGYRNGAAVLASGGSMTFQNEIDTTVAHELGHLPLSGGGESDHGEDGLMSASVNASIEKSGFRPVTIRRFRKARSWTESN